MHEASGSGGLGVSKGGYSAFKGQGSDPAAVEHSWKNRGDRGGCVSFVLRSWVPSIHLAFSLDHKYGLPA